MNVSDARKLRALEDENGKLKKLLAKALLYNAILKDGAAKNGYARGQARCCGSCPSGKRNKPSDLPAILYQAI